jgi:hypothetical protein
MGRFFSLESFFSFGSWTTLTRVPRVVQIPSFSPFRQITSTSYFSGRNGFLPDFEVSTMAVTDRPTGGGLNDQTMLNFAHG